MSEAIWHPNSGGMTTAVYGGAGATSEDVKDILATTAIGDGCGMPSRTAMHRSPG
jgi:hypothetical protein